MKIERVEYSPTDTRWLFYCPGCKMMHSFSTPRWTFNGNHDKPTFSPSLRIYTTRPEVGEVTLCHLFVRDGKIEYCGDSPHHLSGKTVDMVEIEES